MTAKNNSLAMAEQCACRCIHEDRIEHARKTALGEEENVRLAQLFKAMGDSSRLA